MHNELTLSNDYYIELYIYPFFTQMYTPVSMYFPLDVYPKMSQWKNCTHTELSIKKKKWKKNEAKMSILD